jgi:hypothetical protein
MLEREQIIKNYFAAWLNKDNLVLKQSFASNAIYSECYGPEYHSLETIELWFSDWNKRGTVLIWDIKQFIHQGNKAVVEWYFKCEFDGELGDFDGVSIIEFNTENYIVSLKEFQSKSIHYYPYRLDKK